MKTGDWVEVRAPGAARFIRCRVELASSNWKSLALSAEEGLPVMCFDSRSGRQIVMLLQGDDGAFTELSTGGVYEIKETGNG